MKSKNKANVKNRLDLVLIVVLGLFALLLARMFYLTIIKGDEMREIADQRRIRKVYTTAPRGEIRDVHGRLLAGNIPAFTVQIQKDRLLNERDKEKRNENLLKLIRYLEEDGAFYQGEFPMDLNVYIYKNPDKYLTTDMSPTEYMISLFENEDILREFINGKMDLKKYPGHYKFSVKDRALNAVKAKYVDLPVTIEDGNFVANELRLKNFLMEKGFDENLSPDDLMINIIKSDTNIMRKIMNHPIARAILFQIASDHKQLGDIRMLSIAIKSEIEGYENRVKFVNAYDGLDINSTAEEVYLYLARNFALEGILKKTYKDGDLIPGEMLLKKSRSQGKNENIDIYISQDKKSVFFRFINDVKGDPLKTLIGSLTPADLDDFLLEEDIRNVVQAELLSQGINPRISVANEIKFTSEIDTENLYARFFKKSEMKDGLPTVEDLFERAKDSYKIPEEISNYEAKAILNIYELTYLQGESAYKPINLSYGIKDQTVAKIEENIDEDVGVLISVEPIRYYPQGTTLAHILGYMGKISSKAEIEKYVNENGYDKNEFIGKTGVEEYFENYLHGTNGEKMVEVDYIGNTIDVLNVTGAKPGNTLYLTIDSKLQKMAEDYLKRTLELTRTQGVWQSKWGDYQMDGTLDKTRPFIHANAGAVVVMNAKTGEVVASASYPAYDPNLFSTGISETDWKALHPKDENDPLAARPLLNIATGTAVQPGSVFKMITGFAGLQNGLDPFERIYDGGYVEIGDTKFNCLAWTLSHASHGDVDLAHAIEHSCNYYFYSLALGVNQRLNNKPLSARIDIDDIREAGKTFGLNEPTGIEINIPREAVGEVIEPEKKVRTIKFYLRKFLEENIEDFLEDEKTADEIEEDIKNIANWAEEGRSLTKGEIVNRLDQMGYISEKTVPGQKIPLADRIKYDYINQAEWSLADTINVTIGQGASSLTTMQMAKYVSTLVNGGIKNKATLLNSVKTDDGLKDVYRPTREGEKIDIKNPAGYKELMHGMELVSRSGTSRRLFQDFPVSTGSKTGTAEREGTNPTTGLEYDDFAWFVSYAPADDPEVVVASILFQGGTGSNAGPMARDLMAEYLGMNREEVKDSMPFENRLVE